MTTVQDIVGYVIARNNLSGNATDWAGNSNIQDGNGSHILWALTGASITTPGGTRPDGTTTQKLTEDTSNGIHQIQMFSDGSGGPTGQMASLTVAPNHVVFRLAFIVSPSGRTRFVGQLDLKGPRGGANTDFLFSVGFDLTNKQAFDNTADPGWTFIGASVTDVGGGYSLCIADGVFNNTTTDISNYTYTYKIRVLLDNGSGPAARSTTYTGNGSSGILVWWNSLMPKGAWSFTKRTFHDDFNSISTIDVNNTRAPGFNWYCSNYWPNYAFNFYGYTNPNIGPTPAAAISVAGSILTVTPQAVPPGHTLTTYISSAVYSGDLDGNPNGYRLGFTYRFPAYLESAWGFDAVTWSNNYALFFDEIGWFSSDLENFIGTSTKYNEIDHITYQLTGGAGGGVSGDADWITARGKPVDVIPVAAQTTPAFTGGFFSASSVAANSVFYPPVLWSDMFSLNVHSHMVITPELNDGYYSVGMQLFKGQIFNASGDCLFAFGPQAAPPFSTSGVGAYDPLTNQSRVMIMHSANLQSGLPPVQRKTDWVSVWQPPSYLPSALVNHDSAAVARSTQAADLSNAGAGPYTSDRALLDGVAGVNLAKTFIEPGIQVINTDSSAVARLVIDGSSAPTTTVSEARGATGAATSVASSATSVVILPFNQNRLSASIYNESTQILYLLVGPQDDGNHNAAAATTSLYSVQVGPGKFYELPANFIQAVYGLWASANGFARVTEISAPLAYVGPGDLGIPFTAFWGCRAFSAAAVGSRAIQLRRASDNTTIDIVTLPNGALDYHSAAVFGAGTTLKVSAFYDQTGNGYDQTRFNDHFGTTVEGGFSFNTVNGRGTYDNTSGVNTMYGATITQAIADTSNHSFLGVYNIQTAGNFQSIVPLANDEIGLIASFENVPNQISVKNEGTGRGDDSADYTGTTDGAWHVAVGVVNQTTAQNSGITSSFVVADAASPVTHDLAGNPHSTPATRADLTLVPLMCIGGDEGTLPTSTNPLKGFIAEVGWFANPPPAQPWTTSQAGVLTANAKAFWGI